MENTHCVPSRDTALIPCDFLNKELTLHYIHMILYKAWADLRSEARRYYISYLWWVIEPVLEMLVYFVIFGMLLKNKVPHFIPFLLIGLTCWKWFNTTVRHAGNSILNSRSLILQVSLPKVIFPLTVVCTDTFKFLIVFLIVIVFLWCSGFSIGSAYLVLPLLMITQLTLIIALGLFFASIVPFIPDMDILLENTLRIVFFLSGVFFDPRNLSADRQFWFFLNPMAFLINGFRSVLMDGQFQHYDHLLSILAVSLVGILIANRIISRFDKIYPRVVAK
jgi:lipopolysaccharide transport system permease protein